MKLHEFIGIIHNKEELITFLVDNKLIADSIECRKCSNNLKLDRSTLSFRCRKTYCMKNSNKKTIKKQCDFRATAKLNTWCSYSHLSFEKVCLLTAYFIMLRPPRLNFLSTELDISERSVIEWISFCREICIYWAEKKSAKLGGPNAIVEIHEAKISKRKYNHGRIVFGEWVFGGYEQGTDKVFLVPALDHTEQTLLALIKEWVLPGTTIMSDCWKSYGCLNSEGFQHLKDDQSMNFVNPESGGQPVHKERVWREVIPRYGRHSCHLDGYLAEFLFKRVHKPEDRLKSFFSVIAEVYPPNIASEDVEEAIIS